MTSEVTTDLTQNGIRRVWLSNLGMIKEAESPPSWAEPWLYTFMTQEPTNG